MIDGRPENRIVFSWGEDSTSLPREMREARILIAGERPTVDEFDRACLEAGNEVAAHAVRAGGWMRMQVFRPDGRMTYVRRGAHHRFLDIVRALLAHADRWEPAA